MKVESTASEVVILGRKSPFPAADERVVEPVPPDEEDAVNLEREFTEACPHSLDEYCDLCRRLSKRHPYKMVYLGYSLLPEKPLGVCHTPLIP